MDKNHVKNNRKVDITDSCHARLWEIKGKERVTLSEVIELTLDAYDREQADNSQGVKNARENP